MKYADWSKEHNELSAFKAAEDSRKLRLPASPDAYKVENTKEFKPPTGQAMNWQTDDPSLKMAREFAQKKGFSQQDFSEMLDLYAGLEIARQQGFQTWFEGQKTELGAAAQSRIDALTKFVTAMAEPADAKVFLDSLYAAGAVRALESIMDKFRSQGAGSYSTIGSQSAPPNGQIAGYDKMSFVQRRAAQDELRARQASGSGR